MKTFTHIVVIRNPISTNGHNAARRTAELRDLFPQTPITMVDTTPDGRTANQRAIRALAPLFGEHTLLCIAGGDGTINMVIEALLTDEHYSEDMRRMPILPLWCGNANDLAHMLNGPSYKAKLATIMQTGHVVAVRPLACTITYPDGTARNHIAACYASFGASAFAAEMLGRAIRRRHRLHAIAPIRFLHELSTVSMALLKAPTFQITESGKTVIVFEYIFFKGPRFAKVSGVKRHLTDNGFHKARVTPKTLWSILSAIAALTRRKSSKRYGATHAAFTITQATRAQFDGETLHLPAGTQIEMTVADKPFHALSTVAQQHK